MSVSGLCYICNQEANRTCDSCGQPVCSEHYTHEGVCSRCSRGTVMEE